MLVMKGFVLFLALALGASGFSQQASKFAKDAAIDNMAEVKLGQLAINRGISADVRQFGKMMVDDHSMAQNQLMDLAAKLKIKLPAQLDAKSRAVYAKLSKLNGKRFDEAYKAEMVKSHAKDLQILELKRSTTGFKLSRSMR